ncbi:MAG TPA: hypothetical protein VFC07_07990 [Verrucomicrobiae bacterium]|nr:hypothetical protein [Verrucomicrobiae bacterium]
MSDRRHFLLFLAFIGAAVASLLLITTGMGRGPGPRPENTTAASSTQESGIREAAATGEQETGVDQLVRQRREALAAMGAEQARRMRAARYMESERATFQLNWHARWSAVLSSNWPAFQRLRLEAKHSHNKHIPCTICDGRGRMDFCILCLNSGQCVACRGAGKLISGDYCPVCGGSGKCYLCGGIGKMTCPFCDDGEIYANGALPPKLMPLH